ncbi:MAG: glycosyltransferase [Desulfobacteraceae bacterium]|nr:glycosyltransferase [Desulfobacteraceae bacterium]
MPDTLIVIPCFNEADRLPGDELLKFARQHRGLGFILVNDGSTDATGEQLDALHDQLPQRFTALHLPENLGKAGAVRAGFLAAFAQGCQAVGFWDADLATPLAEINHFLTMLAQSRCQMVLGARVRLLGRRIERLAARHYLGRIFATLASFVLGLTIYDTQCGAKLFANTPTLRRVFARPFTVNWIFDVELMARFILIARQETGGRLEEIACERPLEQWLDVPGSKLKAADFLRAIYELAQIWALLHGPGRQRYYQQLTEKTK